MPAKNTEHQALRPDDAQVRLDKWLWAARFFKTRSLAAEAVGGGHVHLNGARIKPSRHIRPQDEIRIRKAHQEWIVIVQALSEQRRPASEAARLYEETAQSWTAREQKAENNRLLAAAHPTPDRKPDKRDRRRIRRLTRRGDDAPDPFGT